jgi:hypothetical protein
MSISSPGTDVMILKISSLQMAKTWRFSQTTASFFKK